MILLPSDFVLGLDEQSKWYLSVDSITSDSVGPERAPRMPWKDDDKVGLGGD
jgi:hypothetical protein